MSILYAMIGAYLIYRLQKRLYKKYWKKQLSVSVTFSKNHAVEGEDLVLTEIITNQKPLPIPIIKVKFMTSKYLGFYDLSNSKVTDHYYRNDMFSLMMYQRLTRDISFQCSRRGYYSIDKAFVVCSDLLLESEYVSELDMDTYLYVFPRPVNYELLQIPFQKMLGTVLSKRFINEDPFEFKSIREYQTYDTLRTINWKASAKTGYLMVNVFDHTTSQQIKILLNLNTRISIHQEKYEEESIRIASALAGRFLEQGLPTALYTNGPDILTNAPTSVKAGSGSHHERAINEALARIDTSVEIPDFLPVLRGEQDQSSHNDYIVLISTAHHEALQQQMISLLNKKQDFLWIIPQSRQDRLKISEELQSHIFPWEFVTD